MNKCPIPVSRSRVVTCIGVVADLVLLIDDS